MFDFILNKIEKVGNKLGNICIIFCYLSIFVILISYPLSKVQFSETFNDKAIFINNLLLGTHLLDIVKNLVTNFIFFQPLSLTIVLTIALSLSESSGFVNTLVKKILKRTSKKYLTPVILLISIIFHIASYSAYIIVIPISAYIYYKSNRHPILGITTAFAGLAGAYTASFIPATLDTVLQGFTQKAASFVDPNIEISILCNYFFSFVSTFVVIIVCTYVSDNIIEKRVNAKYKVDLDETLIKEDKFDLTITKEESKAFYIASTVFFIMLLSLFYFAFQENSIFKDAKGSLTSSKAPLMQGIITLLFIFIVVPSIVYGFLVKKFKSTTMVINACENGLVNLRSFIVFCFFASNFLYIFTKSNLATLIAVYGSNFLKDLNLSKEITLLGILLLTAFLNLFITSAVSKWAILSSIFVPMLMILGIDAAFTQAAFRVSDSSINIITPLFPFYPLILLYAQKYCKDVGYGSICAIMIPYSIAISISLGTLLFIFYALDIPLGF